MVDGHALLESLNSAGVLTAFFILPSASLMFSSVNVAHSSVCVCMWVHLVFNVLLVHANIEIHSPASSHLIFL